MDNVLLLIFGLFLSVLGVVNIKGNISTIHSYNRRKGRRRTSPNTARRWGRERSLWGRP